MIDSDPENETHDVGECSFASTKSGLKTTFHKNQDFADVSGVTIECNNLQSVSKITELIWDWPE